MMIYRKDSVTEQSKTIGVVGIGDVRNAVLLTLVERMNQLQDVFEYRLLQSVQITDPLPKGLHNHPHSVFFSRLDVTRQASGIHYIVGVTSDSLEDNRFNVHDVTTGSGLITIDDIEEYCPKDITRGQYLAYLLLCETLCLVLKHQEHDERCLCLFDMCGEKKDLKHCLRRPLICVDICRKRFSDAHVSGSIIGAADAILRWIGRRNRAKAIWRVSDRLVPGVLIGFAIHLVGGYALELHGLDSVFVLAAALFAYWLYVLVAIRNEEIRE